MTPLGREGVGAKGCSVKGVLVSQNLDQAGVPSLHRRGSFNSWADKVEAVGQRGSLLKQDSCMNVEIISDLDGLGKGSELGCKLHVHRKNSDAEDGVQERADQRYSLHKQELNMDGKNGRVETKICDTAEPVLDGSTYKDKGTPKHGSSNETSDTVADVLPRDVLTQGQRDMIKRKREEGELARLCDTCDYVV